MNVRYLWQGSLRRRLILAVAGVHALLMTLFVWDVTHRQRDLLLELQAGQAEAVARAMANSAAGWLTARDVSGLQELVDAQRRYPELTYAMLLDRQGQVMAHTDGARLGLFVRDLPVHGERAMIERSRELLDVTAPALIEGRLVGWARVGFSQRAVTNRLAELTRAGLLYSLAAIAIGVVLAGLLGTRLTARLYEIRRVSAAVRAGERAARVPALGVDEVAQLGGDFNNMLDALAARESEQQRAEAALRESERHASATFNLAAVGIAHVTPDGRWLRVNQRLADMVGYSPGELLEGGTFQRITRPEDLEADLAQLRRCVAGEIDSYSMEKRYVTRSGAIVWVHLTTKLVRRLDGEPDYFISVIEEVNDRKAAELALRESEQRVRLLLDSTAEGLFGLNIQQRCIFINRAGLRMLGYEREDELLGKDLHSLVHCKYPDGSPCSLDECRVYRAMRDSHGVRVDDDAFWRRDGTPFPVEYSAVPMCQGGEVVGVVATFTDITDRLRLESAHESLEAQLRQAQKMEAVGQLAGGVAHDFNNLLTAILGNASLLENSGRLSEEQAEWLNQIREAGNRAASLTQRLLTFSRRQRFECRELDLNEVAAGMRGMLQQLLGEGIEFQLELASEPMPVWADRGMLEQVLLNLAVNARDALAPGGRFTLGTAAVDMDPGAERTHPGAVSGPALRLTASDNGRGIAAEHLARIFEPFFTTKDVGRGTGLGLSIVHGILEQHGGWIEVESQLGQGTSFHLYFPRSSGHHEVAPAVEAATATPQRGHEVILLAEDDKSVLRLARSALEGAGYRVFGAADGPSALALWEQRRDEIRLLMVDMVMPGGMSGAQLAEQVRRQVPELPVLFCSGYMREEIEQKILQEKRTAFLGKPYEVPRLLTLVRQLLDAG